VEKQPAAYQRKPSGERRLMVAGLELCELRRRAGISLDDVIGRTKISRRFLLAIEEGCYEELPGGVFTRSYLRQYAEAVGVEPQLLLDHCQKNSGPVETRAAATPRPWLKVLLSGL
jgi:cytoskeleton protein RodZ